MVFLKLIKSFKFAFEGVWYCISNERNFRIHIIAAIFICLIAPYYTLTISEKILLAFTVALVFITEMLNTSIEALVDLVTKDKHKLAKMAKDIAAGVVLIAAFNAIFVAYLLFFKFDKIQIILMDISKSVTNIVLTVLFIICAYLFLRGWKKDV